MFMNDVLQFVSEFHLILPTLDKIRLSPSRILRKTRLGRVGDSRGHYFQCKLSFGNYFYGGNSSTICKRIFLTFSTNTRKLPNLYMIYYNYYIGLEIQCTSKRYFATPF